MFLSTMNDMPGYRVEAVFGEVMGVTVRARDFGSQMIAGFRSLGGGEVTEMTRQLYDARVEAGNRMVTEAQARGANAILALRYSASEIGGNWTELCAYGTAVVVRPLAQGEPGATPQSASQATRHTNTADATTP